MLSPGSLVRDARAARRQATSTSEREHRPWPLPDRSWLMGQSWLDLLFAHWRVDPQDLRRVVPPQLELDVVEGSAWVGVTPFEVRAFRLRFAPPAPLVSAFPELNVRTYVTVDGKPGIYFLSLDAASRFAVTAARRTYRFPYFRARMSLERQSRAVAYRSDRVDQSGPPARFAARYGVAGESFRAEPGSLEWSLVERYCAYTLDGRERILRAEIHHRPWTLHRAEADFALNTMAEPLGIALEGEPLLHVAAPQDVVVWPHERA